MAVLPKEHIQQLAAALQQEFQGKILLDEPMSAHTTFGIGGPADIFAMPVSVEDLTALLSFSRANHLPVTPLGDGSNVLVSDLGIRGVVVKLSGDFNRWTPLGDEIMAGAGMGLSSLIAETASAGLAGLEVVYGVPGSVGGGIYMNCGTRYGWLSDLALAVQVTSLNGEDRWIEAPDMGFAYRTSALMQSPEPVIVTEARFKLKQEAPGNIKDRIREMSLARKASQPLNWRSCGCMFKNPEGDSAGRLIDAAGLKGLSMGAATVSDKHANFFVVSSGATATDIRGLAETVRARVMEKFEVELQMEVCLMGEWPEK